MMVGHPDSCLPGTFPISPPSENSSSRCLYPKLASVARESNLSFVSDHFGEVAGPSKPMSTPTIRLLPTITETPGSFALPSRLPFWNRPPNLKKALTKTKTRKDTISAPRRHLPARPSALPIQPDVSSFTTEVDQSADYVVLVSMYEVYNDRIFDLLSSSMQTNVGAMTTRQGAALQKDLRRRPLLFKSTEMSPDRKVVAGLRKVVCGTYEEAMMILETGLAERRVAGTGSNTASSRSHGFFCIEVKRNNRFRQFEQGVWTGGVLSIVDLAGSERARNAKTTGSTLAEAGKINESLMYLGQCLQVQSEHHDGSKPIVPFRQCKLTELLFSNSFSTSSNHTSRAPQKAIMIVTADPQGDFNATSQILRYSALAREVTVPRIPSVTSTILHGPHLLNKQNGRQTPHGEQLFSAEELEQAANEIARLGEDCDQLAIRLAEEEIKRSEAEFKLQAALQAAEEKALLIEQEVREECWSQMEADMEAEKERWRRAKDEERFRAEGYLDGKIEILEKGVTIDVHEDNQQVTDEVLRENEALRRKVAALERQLNMRSPTKPKPKAPKPKPLSTPLKENTNPASNPFLSALRNSSSGSSRGITETDDGLSSAIKKLDFRDGPVMVEDPLRKVSEPKTPGTTKRVRKLTTRKWDFGNSGDEEEC
jgi:Kinesin motor domain